MTITTANRSVEMDPEKNESHDAADSAPIGSEALAEMNPAVKLHGWRLILTMPCMLIGLCLATIDSSIVSTALVKIGDDFHNFIQTIWIVLGYLISYMTFAMTWCRLSDVFGRKYCFIAATLLLLAFSLGCALSRSLNELILFRVLQGMAGSGLYSLANIVLPEISPNNLYSFMLGAQGSIFTLSGALGPLLGGIIATNSTWRWIFYMNLPICAVVAVVLTFSWKENAPAQLFKERFKTLLTYDFLGIGFFTVATTCFVLGLEFGGSSFSPWLSPTVLGLICAAVVCSVALVVWNSFCSSIAKNWKIQPLFAPSLIKIRLVSAAFIICALGGFNLFMGLITIPQRFQIVNGNSPLMAGVRLSPFLAANAVGSTTSGLICAKKNLTFYIVFASCGLQLIGACLLMSLPSGVHIDPRGYVYQVIYGLGTGGILSSTGYMTGINSNYRDYALSSGIISQARIFGGCIGLTLSTVILNGTIENQLRSILSTSQLQALRQSLDSASHLSPEAHRAVTYAVARAFVWQFRVAACVAGLSLLCSLACWTRHPISLKRRLEIGERVSRREITPEEGDKVLREGS